MHTSLFYEMFDKGLEEIKENMEICFYVFIWTKNQTPYMQEHSDY